MSLHSRRIYSRLIFGPLVRGVAIGGGDAAAGGPDEGYLTEDGDFYLLETGVSTDSYLLEGAFLETEDSEAAPDDIILQQEDGPLLELEQGA